ncbi:Bromodomain [Dillenia turbinata]|uniref:Bromodomain n=1 Tax=Dillenia turbinata TaxID=194707 RepID=A0AAN8USM5_9MAGN
MANEDAMIRKTLKFKILTSKLQVGQKDIHANTKTSNKRPPTAIIDDQNRKRPKRMDCIIKEQCSVLLKKLMNHPAGWVFNQPVDPLALNIPDYFSIISHPMDLGTIKSKLEKSIYIDHEEFAADVRLTFSNAMLYNPPANNVHLMAKELSDLFEDNWKSMEAKRKCGKPSGNLSEGAEKVQEPKVIKRVKSTTYIGVLSSKKLMSPEEKQKLRVDLVKVWSGKIPQQLRESLQSFGLLENKERVGLDIDDMSDDKLWLLRRTLRGHCDATAAKAKSTEIPQRYGSKTLVNDISKAKPRPPVNTAAQVCCSCGKVTCQCSRQINRNSLSSGVSSQKSLSGVNRSCSGEGLKMSKLDPDSEGHLSSLDEEITCTGSGGVSATTCPVASEEWETPITEVSSSPQRALRAASLKSRFAGIISKAQQLSQGNVVDPVRLQQDKERLERKQLEGNLAAIVKDGLKDVYSLSMQCDLVRRGQKKERIRLLIKAAQDASRQKAKSQREAARLAVEQMRKTVDITRGHEIVRDVEMLCRRFRSENVMESLGLFIKFEYSMEGDIDSILDGDGEEGEILLTLHERSGFVLQYLVLRYELLLVAKELINMVVSFWLLWSISFSSC